MVGQALGRRLVALGHEVCMGSRQANNPDAEAFVRDAGEGASQGTFADAAAFGDVVINATAGMASLEALRSAGPANLSGKVLIDVANVLDFSAGTVPSAGPGLADSLAERIQAAFPDARVVKTLNTVNGAVMADPAGLLPGDTGSVFLSGDDAAAKSEVASLLESFGWPRDSIVDLGDITTARGPELYVALWLRVWGVVGDATFNIRVVAPGAASASA
jgi:predicted dinucleotide-binding enzyme